MRISAAVIAAICIFLVYLLIPTKTYYWDGVLFSFYAEQARRGEMAIRALFHPNHLIYTPFAWLVSVPGVRSIRILQACNAFAGAICAYWMFLFGRRAAGSQAAGFAAMTLFAFGATWWKFATDADAYILAVLFCFAAVWFALRRDVAGLILAIACHTIAMLFHELAIFLYFPILIALTGTARRIWYIAVSAALVIAAYSSAFIASGHPGQPTFISWITSYAGDTPVTHSLRQIAVGYAGSYLKLFAGGKISLIRQFFGPVLTISLIASAALLVLSLRLWRKTSDSPHPKLTAVLLAWFVPLAIFLAVFDPASTFHKLFLWPPLVLLICIACRRHAVSTALLASALACWNFGAFIWPHAHAAADPVLSFAEDLKREIPSNGVIYFSAFSPDDWYLRYFGPTISWQPLPAPANSRQPVCFETTALGAIPGAWNQAQRKWSLQTSQHDIRVACLAPHFDRVPQ